MKNLNSNNRGPQKGSRSKCKGCGSKIQRANDRRYAGGQLVHKDCSDYDQSGNLIIKGQ